MHSWHDVKPNRLKPDDFLAVIEISKGSKNKYELDKETGHLILDRVLIGETIGTIGQKLIPNLLSFVVQFLSFLVLLIVVFVFAYKPVKKILKKRADYVENEIKEAKENNLQAQKNVEEAKEMIAQSKVQASEIIKNAEKQGQEKYDALIMDAKAEVEEMKVGAQEDIERAKEEAIQDIRNEMVNVALSASEEILKREVDSEDNKRLAEDFINRLN